MEPYATIQTGGSASHVLFMRDGSSLNRRRQSDIPVQCGFSTATLLYIVEDFLSQAKRGVSVEEASLYRHHVTFCAESWREMER